MIWPVVLHGYVDEWWTQNARVVIKCVSIYGLWWNKAATQLLVTYCINFTYLRLTTIHDLRFTVWMYLCFIYSGSY